MLYILSRVNIHEGTEPCLEFQNLEGIERKMTENNKDNKKADNNKEHPEYRLKMGLPPSYFIDTAAIRDALKFYSDNIDTIRSVQDRIAAISNIYDTIGLISSTRPRILSEKEQKLEEDINNLKAKEAQLRSEIEMLRADQVMNKKEVNEWKNRVQELGNIIEDSNKKQRLRHLLDRVNDVARTKLLDSEDFMNRFESSKTPNVVVMAVDIRRSTELMLKAREPQFYAEFITGLCTDLTKIILDNYGIFDKFTGDGILAFFPDFFSGEDAPYLAVKSAEQCHKCFSDHYHDKRKYFNSVLKDAGLGIGIDYGEAHLVKLQDGLTVIGTPVVYACRMSGAAAGQTLLNQPAYEIVSEKFGKCVTLQESEIDIKHEGRTVAYLATLAKKTYEPKLPEWVGK